MVEQIWQLPTFSVTFTRPFLLKSDPSRPGCSSSSSSWHLRAATLFLYRNDALHWTYRVPSISASRLHLILIVRQKSPTIRASFEGLNRTRPKIARARDPSQDYHRTPPPLPLLRGSIRSRTTPPTRISSLTSRFENFYTPLGNFPPSSAFDRFRPYQLSSSFLSLSTLEAISIYPCSPSSPLPYLPPNANAAPFDPPRLIFYNFIDRYWYRRIVERVVDRIVHEDSHANKARCLSNFSSLLGHPKWGWSVPWNYRSSTMNGKDDLPSFVSKIFFQEIFCEIEIEIEGWSRGSSHGRRGKVWDGLGNSALKTWRCLTPRLSLETCSRGLCSRLNSRQPRGL